MQISLLLALQILKLFAIMLMGYAIVKLGLLKASDSKALSVVLVYLIMPCVIINAFQVEATPEVQKGLALACVAAVAVHILFLVITIPLRKLLHLNAHLSERRHPRHPAGAGASRTGVRHLLQCLRGDPAHPPLEPWQVPAL